MKNLYARLHIDPNANERQIAFALEHCENDALRDDAEYILLDPARKAVYDRNHRMLVKIAALRERLNLTDTPHWGIREYGDYITQPLQGAKTDEDHREDRHQESRHAPTWLDNDYLRFWLIFGMLVCVYAIIAYMIG